MSEVQWNERGAEEAAVVGLPFVKFATVGTQFIGKYVSQAEETSTFNNIEKKRVVYTFENRQGKFKIDPNPDLRKRLATLKIDEIARITYVADKDVGQASPMKVFKLEVAKMPAPAPAPASPF